MKSTQIILASTSPIRRKILNGAGLSFSVASPNVDEAVIKTKALAQNTPVSEIALKLALAKAKDIKATDNAYIIGADQIMEMDDQIFDKPKTMNDARERLRQMRGKTHRLIGGLVCVQKNTQSVWTHKSETKLTMRMFSDKFIDEYLNHEGEDLLYTVGTYKFEGRGAQLFERVEGDFYSILGLSLLPLLGHLRDVGAVEI